VPDAAKENLYRVSTEGGKPTLIVEPSTGGYTSLEIPQKTAKPVLVAGYGSSVSPAEIVASIPRAARTSISPMSTPPRRRPSIGGRPKISTSPAPRTEHPQHDRAAAGVRSCQKISMLVLIHGGAASNNPDQIGLR